MGRWDSVEKAGLHAEKKKKISLSTNTFGYFSIYYFM